MYRNLFHLALLVAIAGLAACGGSHSVPPVAPTTSPSGTSTAVPSPGASAVNATFVIAISAPATPAVRQREDTPAATASIRIASGSTTLVTANVAAGSSSCTSQSGGGRNCSITAAVPNGTDTFAITAYDGANGTGTVLASGSVIATVSASAATIDVALTGTAAKLEVSLANAYPPVGASASTDVIVDELDADGNIILGAFPSNVTLADSDTSGATTLSSTTVTSAASTSTLSYTGAAPFLTATITASTSGLGSATTTFAPVPAFLATYQAPSDPPPLVFLSLEFADIAYGPDGNMWVVSADPAEIVKVTPNGTMTQYALSSSSAAPSGLVVGADGNLWFAEQQNNAVGKLVIATGVVTNYPLPTGTAGYAQPYCVTLGKDGNIWFADQANDVAGSVTPTGTVTEYPLPANDDVYGITSGPDGNLWMSDQGNNTIVKMSTAGAVLGSFAIPTANAHPWGIIGGPDGNVWFTEDAAGKISRITPSGTIAEFSTPTGSSSTPSHLAVGPDGRIWYGEMGNETGIGKIGYITTDGSQSRDFVGDGIHVFSIAFAANGILWYSAAQTLGASEVGTFAY
jgi:streptogramin lyase